MVVSLAVLKAGLMVELLALRMDGGLELSTAACSERLSAARMVALKDASTVDLKVDSSGVSMAVSKGKGKSVAYSVDQMVGLKEPASLSTKGWR